MKNTLPAVILIFLIVACQPPKKEEVTESIEKAVAIPQAISLFGDSLYATEPSEKTLEKYETRKKEYVEDSLNVDKIIWFGRFAAYKGDYHEAIAIYSKGIERFPEESRLYRHRGHRYISTRQFAKAIEDLEYASKLIEGTENEMEPDGLPNAQNIPVSSKHGNIWYHLGLAYYLQQDFDNSLRAYKECLNSTTNDDNLVSSTHWIYMILRRQGLQEEANTYLDAINDSLNIIENTAYHKACLFYKGNLTLDELQTSIEEGSGGDAMRYALGNWYFYNGEKEKSKAVYTEMIEGGGWNSFGYIAAEADLFKAFN